MIFIYFKFPPVHFADACFICKSMLCYVKSEQRKVPIVETLKRRIDQGSKRPNKFSLIPTTICLVLLQYHTLHQIIQLLCA